MVKEKMNKVIGVILSWMLVRNTKRG